MNYEISNASNVTFYNKDTNEPIFTSDCIGSVDFTYKEESAQIIPTFSMNKTTNNEATFNIGKIDHKLLSELLFPQNKELFKLEVQGKHKVKVQARKHRQKRINKKWLKIYGYKTVLKPITFEIPKCYVENLDYIKENLQ